MEPDPESDVDWGGVGIGGGRCGYVTHHGAGARIIGIIGSVGSAGSKCARGAYVILFVEFEFRFRARHHVVHICRKPDGYHKSPPMFRHVYDDSEEATWRMNATKVAVRGMLCGRRGSMTFTVWLLLHRRGLTIAACRISLSDWLHRMVAVCKTVGS